MTEEAQFIIIEDKYTLSIIKNDKNNKKPKDGISIFKKTLELNKLNEDNIKMILKNSNKEDIFYSYANIGFISIAGLICFIYCNEKDIKEIGIISFIKVYQVRNIHYLIIEPEMEKNTKKEILKFFKEFTDYEVNKGLIFTQNYLNLEQNFDEFYHHLYDINKNICHINPTINYCYNYDYMTYFRKFGLEEYASHLICGYYYQKTIKKPQKDELVKNPEIDDLTIHLIIKDKALTNDEEDEEEEKIEKEKIIKQIEIILTSNNLGLNQIFHFLFFSFIGDYLEIEKTLYNLLIDKQPENKVNNGPVLIIDIQNKIKGKNNEEKNEFISDFSNKIKKEIGDNTKIIYIEEEKEINKTIEKYRVVLDDIKYNYEIKGIENILEFEKNQLLIISDNENNSINIMESVLNIIKYKFIDEFGQMPYTKGINEYIGKVMKYYKKYITLKNDKFLKIQQISSHPINEAYLNKKYFRKIKLENKEEKIKESKEKTKESDSDTLIVDFGSLDDNNQKNIDIIKIDNDEYNININNIINSKNDNTNIEVKENKDNIVDNNKFTIYIVTNNVSNYNLENRTNIEETLKKLLFPKEIKKHFSKDSLPTFYCIGLQEIVELNTSNIIFELNKNSVKLWESNITQLLQKNYNYTLQFRENLVGVLFLFFVKTSEAKNITNMKNSVIKAGFLNALGNKGYILYEFKYKNKIYSFCTGHLTAGENEKNIQNRYMLLKDILNHQFDKNSKKLYENDFYFLFGDMNFRVKLDQKKFFKQINDILFLNKKVFDDSFIKNKPNMVDDIFKPFVYINKKKERKTCCSAEKYDSKYMEDSDDEEENDDQNNAIKKQKTENIELMGKKKIDEEQFKMFFHNNHLEKEELNALKSHLKKYKINEHKINFLPTYKYIKGYNYYNVKKRIPSWTDRILFKKNKDIQCLYYNRIDVRYSDHRPVYALFEVTINNNK